MPIESEPGAEQHQHIMNDFKSGSSRLRECLTRAAIVLAFLCALNLRAEISPKYYAVEASVNVQSSPAQITLSWPADPRATGYTIHRKAPTASGWSPKSSLPGSAQFYADTDVIPGTTYEYQISKSTSYGYIGFTYLFAGIEAPMVENRGKVILIVDNTHAADLASELARLQQDLVGDGWTVVRRDVSRQDSPPKVKSIIKAEYDADRANVRSVFLFGHVAVPYSGDFVPDGHAPDHQGAWPADAYYGDMDGNWTDNSVNSTGADRDRNRNRPGDGKFDQSQLPSDVDLEVGRVDLYNMTNFANKSPARSEKDLLRQYLNKDHRFRHRLMQVERRGLICDNFGEAQGEAFASSGWRNFASFFGAANVSEVPGWNYFPTVTSQSYLWSYGTGGGSFYTCNGIGSSDDFATKDIKTVFTMFLGSYFGDWDNESNFLRSPLGSSSYTLTASWSGRPHWFYHHMALGETIGFSTRLSQNNSSGGLYGGQNGVPSRQSNWAARQVHIALMGDPTLRMHPVVPPANVRGSASGSGVTLSWDPSTDSDLAGYYVYRADTPSGPFSRVTRSSPVSSTSFTDPQGSSRHVYMVRAIKLERSASGTYYNPSQGAFYNTSNFGTPPPEPTPAPATAPIAPTGLTLSSLDATRISLSWIDPSNNENGFKIQRKSSPSGAYQEIATLAANAINYTDTSLTTGTTYFYRVTAFNSAGDSAPSIEASLRLEAPILMPANARFVTTDTATRGNWKGVYGAEGYHILGDAVSYPPYAVVTSNGATKFEWGDSSTDPRALLRAESSSRVPACWYADSGFNVEINFTDGKTHRLALYCVDWDTSARSQKIEILAADTGAVLDSRTLSQFNSGSYLVWDLQGRIRIRFTKLSGNNALLMGMFFGPAASQLGTTPPSTPPTLSVASGQSLAQGRFSLRVQGQPGQKFTIQASDDLRQWSPLNTVTLSGSQADFIDAQAGSFPKRFYRAIPTP